jgi:hypothetical protein
MQVKDGPGNCSGGNAIRLDSKVKLSPFHRFTISKSGGDPLGMNNGTR